LNQRKGRFVAIKPLVTAALRIGDRQLCGQFGSGQHVFYQNRERYHAG
jgi:hypothetical protein